MTPNEERLYELLKEMYKVYSKGPPGGTYIIVNDLLNRLVQKKRAVNRAKWGKKSSEITLVV